MALALRHTTPESQFVVIERKIQTLATHQASLADGLYLLRCTSHSKKYCRIHTFATSICTPAVGGRLSRLALKSVAGWANRLWICPKAFLTVESERLSSLPMSSTLCFL